MSGAETEAIMLAEPGGPEVLRLATVPLGQPGPGELLIRQTAAGVNFHDTYVRSGAYKTLKLPGVPGLEGTGVIEALGEGVTDFAVGDRIAYIDNRYGGYARQRVLKADLAVPLPAGVDDRAAAAWFLKGLTALVLVEQVHRLRPGDAVLVQAAGGGVGQLLARLAKQCGCTVIGTAGDETKQQLARQAGCDHVIAYREADVLTEVRRIVGSKGVAVAYDAVGKDKFEGSLATLGLRGHLVLYGQASGPVPPFELSRLGAQSLSISRPFLWAYVEGPEALRALSARLFGMIAAGELPVTVGGHFSLAQAAEAHRALESRVAGPFVLDC